MNALLLFTSGDGHKIEWRTLVTTSLFVHPYTGLNGYPNIQHSKLL